MSRRVCGIKVLKSLNGEVYNAINDQAFEKEGLE